MTVPLFLFICTHSKMLEPFIGMLFHIDFLLALKFQVLLDNQGL